MQNYWTREHPDPPPKKPSDWYCFIFDGEDDVSIIEVYPERAHWPEGLWGPRIEDIPENPLKQKKKTKQEEPKKRGRGRPRKNARNN